MKAPRSMPTAEAAPTFNSFEDFLPAFNAARHAAIAVFGERWDLHPQAYVWARLPTAWTQVRVAGRTIPRPIRARFDEPTKDSGQAPRERLPDDVISERWSRAPRDQKLPTARFWENQELPIGPDYALSPPTAKPSKPRLVRNAEPQKIRRPSGIGLPSGYEQERDGFYLEPKWVVEALLDVETFTGAVHDPFCGGGNIVGTCLQRGIAATGSDLHDRGFGTRRDALSITETVDNVLSNPPFGLIEDAIRHFLPLVRHKLVLFARLNILESQERRVLFDKSPPAHIWISSRRVSVPPGHLQHPRDQFGAVIPLPASGGSTAYCWVVLDREHVGPPVLGWL
jgi:hypothetical protein